jgi:hypothetical protein
VDEAQVVEVTAQRQALLTALLVERFAGHPLARPAPPAAPSARHTVRESDGTTERFAAEHGGSE